MSTTTTSTTTNQVRIITSFTPTGTGQIIAPTSGILTVPVYLRVLVDQPINYISLFVSYPTTGFQCIGLTGFNPLFQNIPGTSSVLGTCFNSIESGPYSCGSLGFQCKTSWFRWWTTLNPGLTFSTMTPFGTSYKLFDVIFSVNTSPGGYTFSFAQSGGYGESVLLNGAWIGRDILHQNIDISVQSSGTFSTTTTTSTTIIPPPTTTSTTTFPPTTTTTSTTTFNLLPMTKTSLGDLSNITLATQSQTFTLPVYLEVRENVAINSASIAVTYPSNMFLCLGLTAINPIFDITNGGTLITNCFSGTESGFQNCGNVNVCNSARFIWYTPVPINGVTFSTPDRYYTRYKLFDITLQSLSWGTYTFSFSRESGYSTGLNVINLTSEYIDHTVVISPTFSSPVTSTTSTTTQLPEFILELGTMSMVTQGQEFVLPLFITPNNTNGSTITPANVFGMSHYIFYNNDAFEFTGEIEIKDNWFNHQLVSYTNNGLNYVTQSAIQSSTNLNLFSFLTGLPQINNPLEYTYIGPTGNGWVGFSIGKLTPSVLNQYQVSSTQSLYFRNYTTKTHILNYRFRARNSQNIISNQYVFSLSGTASFLVSYTPLNTNDTTITRQDRYLTPIIMSRRGILSPTYWTPGTWSNNTWSGNLNQGFTINDWNSMSSEWTSFYRYFNPQELNSHQLHLSPYANYSLRLRASEGGTRPVFNQILIYNHPVLNYLYEIPQCNGAGWTGCLTSSTPPWRVSSTILYDGNVNVDSSPSILCEVKYSDSPTSTIRLRRHSFNFYVNWAVNSPTYSGYSYSIGQNPPVSSSLIYTNTINSATGSSSSISTFTFSIPFTYSNTTLITLQASTNQTPVIVNATDALEAARYSAELISLSELKKKAANVNASSNQFGSTINATDALQIAQRFVELRNSFNAGDWVLHPSTFSISSLSLTHSQGRIYYYLPLRILTMGDVKD